MNPDIFFSGGLFDPEKNYVSVLERYTKEQVFDCIVSIQDVDKKIEVIAHAIKKNGVGGLGDFFYKKRGFLEPCLESGVLERLCIEQELAVNRKLHSILLKLRGKFKEDLPLDELMELAAQRIKYISCPGESFGILLARCSIGNAKERMRIYFLLLKNLLILHKNNLDEARTKIAALLQKPAEYKGSMISFVNALLRWSPEALPYYFDLVSWLLPKNNWEFSKHICRELLFNPSFVPSFLFYFTKTIFETRAADMDTRIAQISRIHRQIYDYNFDVIHDDFSKSFSVYINLTINFFEVFKSDDAISFKKEFLALWPIDYASLKPIFELLSYKNIYYFLTNSFFDYSDAQRDFFIHAISVEASNIFDMMKNIKNKEERVLVFDQALNVSTHLGKFFSDKAAFLVKIKKEKNAVAPILGDAILEKNAVAPILEDVVLEENIGGIALRELGIFSNSHEPNSVCLNSHRLW